MQPGTDVALFNAMLHHIVTRGLEDKRFVAERMHDFEKVRESVKAMTPDVAAKITGVPADRIRWAAELYAQGPRTSTLWAMGLTQHANGTDLVTSLLNLMLACGMIGRWGAAMMPVRGQNNVQGASDVGAIPFVYTDYRPVKDPKNRAEYAAAWGVPPESLSLKEGLMVTEIVKSESGVRGDRKSTRLNSSHGYISYAVFCLKKKKMASLGHMVIKSRPSMVADVTVRSGSLD